jgi:hypothetical protein
MSFISKKWIGGLVFLFIFAGLCFGVMHWRTERMIASAYEACGSPESISIKELSLDDSQRTVIRSLQENYRSRISELCARHCDSKRKLAGLLAASPRDDEAIRNCAAEVGRLEADAERATTDHVLAMAGAMKPEQAEIFLRKFSAEIVKTCPIVFAPEAK